MTLAIPRPVPLPAFCWLPFSVARVAVAARRLAADVPRLLRRLLVPRLCRLLDPLLWRLLEARVWRLLEPPLCRLLDPLLCRLLEERLWRLLEPLLLRDPVVRLLVPLLRAVAALLREPEPDPDPDREPDPEPDRELDPEPDRELEPELERDAAWLRPLLDPLLLLVPEPDFDAEVERPRLLARLDVPRWLATDISPSCFSPYLLGPIPEAQSRSESSATQG